MPHGSNKGEESVLGAELWFDKEEEKVYGMFTEPTTPEDAENYNLDRIFPDEF